MLKTHRFNKSNTNALQVQNAPHHEEESTKFAEGTLTLKSFHLQVHMTNEMIVRMLSLS